VAVRRFRGSFAAELINEVTTTKIPIFIGRGIPWFWPLAKDEKLRHIETLSFENGFVQSNYEVLE